MIKDFVTVAGLRTHYWHAGNGPVLLLLHGQLPGSCVAVEWSDQIQRFADAGYAVYAIDEAGFGQTDNPKDYSIETRIAHARAFVDHIAPERYHIWGCSMGTLMGCTMAMTDTRIDKLVLMPSTLLPPPLPNAPPATAPVPGSVGELARRYTPSMDNARELLKRVLKNPAALSEERVRLVYENSKGKNEEAERQRNETGRPAPIYAGAAAREEPVSHSLGCRRSELAAGAHDPDAAAAAQCRDACRPPGGALAASGSARPHLRARERLSRSKSLSNRPGSIAGDAFAVK